MELTHLFQPGRIGKMELKNRLVMAPMGTFSSDAEGFLLENTADYYEARARGGVGLIIAQSSSALREARAPYRPGSWDDKFIPGLSRVAEAVHRHGGKIAWQVLAHGKLLSRWRHLVARPEEIRIIGPSAVPWWKNNFIPQEATLEDIERMARGFARAARRVKEAGFDAVEVHGAHGYLITQWLSPRDNRRTDAYGGTPERRARFAGDIIRYTREEVGPDFPIIFRFSASDFTPGGVTLEDSLRQAPLFVEAGADCLHISACEDASTQWQFLSYLYPDAAIIHLAAAIKQAVPVPVIAVGKIGSPLLAERLLAEGKADFIAMGRALLADPELPHKAREGRLEDIRPCIYCNDCVHRLNLQLARQEPGTGQHLTCAVNPEVLRERELALKPAPRRKRVMVIGGGLAGLEAARALARRGHEVSLHEKRDRLGGQWDIAARQPGKERFADLTRYLAREVEQAGVRVHLNHEVTPDTVRQARPDAIVIATGAIPATLPVAGADGRNVVQAVDVITGKARPGARVVVVGGRYLGLEVADYLADQGKRVCLVTRSQLGRDVDPSIFRTLRDRLIQKGVQLFQHAPVYEIREEGVYIVFNSDLVLVEADTVVLAVGSQPQRRLADELKGLAPEVHVIGDCMEARGALEAIREGAEVGRQI